MSRPKIDWQKAETLDLRLAIDDGSDTYLAHRADVNIHEFEEEYREIAEEFAKGYDHGNNTSVTVFCVMKDFLHGDIFKFEFNGEGYFEWCAQQQ